MLSKRVLMLAAVFTAALHADVTLRYQTKVKMNPTLPAQMAEQATKGMGGAVPPEMTMQWKDGKGVATFGRMRSITDLIKKEVTLLDPEKKEFATTTMEEVAGQIAKSMTEMPPEGKAAMAQMKFSTDSKVTGRTETIQGIPGEEREVVLTMEGPTGPNRPSGPIMKMSFSFWMAKDEDVYRHPALRELKGYNVWAYETMNPTAMMERMFQAVPGMGEGLSKFMKEMPKTMMLRSQMTMRMPIFATMMKQMPEGQSPFGKDFDPEAPFMEMTQELTEISTAPVPASAVAIPEGYQSVPVAALVKTMMEAFKQGPKQQ